MTRGVDLGTPGSRGLEPEASYVVEVPGVREVNLAECILAAVKFILDCDRSELRSKMHEYPGPADERYLNIFLMSQLQQALELMVKGYIAELMFYTMVWRVKSGEYILITPYDNVYDVRRKLYRKHEIHKIIGDVAEGLREVSKKFNIGHGRNLASLLEEFKNDNEEIIRKMVDVYWYRYADVGKCIDIGPGKVKVDINVTDEEIKEALEVTTEFGRRIIEGDLRRLVYKLKIPKKIKIATAVSCVLEENCRDNSSAPAMPIDKLIKRMEKKHGYSKKDVRDAIRRGEKYGWIKVYEEGDQEIVARVRPQDVLREDGAGAARSRG